MGSRILLFTGLILFSTAFLYSQPGTVQWSFRAGDDIRTSPAIGPDRTIYFGSNDNKVYALHPDGTKKWTFSAGGMIRSSPAIGQDAIMYVGSHDNTLYALHPDGTQQWTFHADDAIASSPAIGSHGTIYVGSLDNRVYAIDPGGTEQWHFDTGGDIWSSPAVGADGTIYIGNVDEKFFAINPDGTKEWVLNVGMPVTELPAIGADSTIYVSGSKFLAINPDGTQQWSHSGSCGSPVIGEDGTIYVGFIERYLYAFNPDGTIQWKFDGLDKWNTHGWHLMSIPVLGHDGTIFFGVYQRDEGVTDAPLYAIHADGTEKWSLAEIGGTEVCPAIGDDGTLYVVYENSLNAIECSSMGLADSPWPRSRGNNRNTGQYDYVPTHVHQETGKLANTHVLQQNFPNPFNAQTTIVYSLPRQAKAKLVVYNLLGQEIATLVDQVKPAGKYTVRFDASNLSNGIYTYRLFAGSGVITRKMLLLK